MKKALKFVLAVFGLAGLFMVASCGGASGKVTKKGPDVPEPAVLIQNGTFQGLGVMKRNPTYDFVNADRIASCASNGYWQFLIGDSFMGKGECEISNGLVKVTVRNPGTDPWSIQLVQIPVYMKKGQMYKVTFEAKATAKRQIMSKVSKVGGDWKAYSSERYIEIGTNMQQYSYSFQMSDPTDPYSRFELNFGKDTNTVWVQNVNIEKK